MELNERILHYMDKTGTADTLKLANEFNEDHQKIVGAVKSLEALEMVVSEAVKSTKWELTEEGQLVADKGSHEAVLYRSVPDGGIPQAELMKVSFRPSSEDDYVVHLPDGLTILIIWLVRAPRVHLTITVFFFNLTIIVETII